MAPISRLVMLPVRHSIGISQRGSAFCRRPIDSENQTLAPKSSRRLGASSRRAKFSPAGLSRDGVNGATSIRSSGAERLARHWRTKAAATCSAPCLARRASMKPRSSSFTGSSKAGSARMRSSSRRITSSAEGGLAHVALSPAFCNRRSVRLRALLGTISALTPLRPARPVRPLRCSSVSGLVGRSAWITSSRLGRSMPRAATSVAMQTLARPSRIACSAWLRSFWLSSPDSATTEKLRLLKRAVRCLTAARVLQNTSAFLRLVIAQHVDDGVLAVGLGNAQRPVFDVGMLLVLAGGRRCARRRAGSPCASVAMARGTVAENISVRRSAGAASRMNSRSSRKPRSSISSASSSTTALERRHVERMPRDVVAQAAGRADDDMRAALQRTPLRAHVHAADAGRDAWRRSVRRAIPVRASPAAPARASAPRPAPAVPRRGQSAPRRPAASAPWQGRRRRSCRSRSARKPARRPAPSSRTAFCTGVSSE